MAGAAAATSTVSFALRTGLALFRAIWPFAAPACGSFLKSLLAFWSALAAYASASSASLGEVLEAATFELNIPPLMALAGAEGAGKPVLAAPAREFPAIGEPAIAAFAFDGAADGLASCARSAPLSVWSCEDSRIAIGGGTA